VRLDPSPIPKGNSTANSNRSYFSPDATVSISGHLLFIPSEGDLSRRAVEQIRFRPPKIGYHELPCSCPTLSSPEAKYCGCSTTLKSTFSWEQRLKTCPEDVIDGSPRRAKRVRPTSSSLSKSGKVSRLITKTVMCKLSLAEPGARRWPRRSKSVNRACGATGANIPTLLRDPLTGRSQRQVTAFPVVQELHTKRSSKKTGRLRSALNAGSCRDGRTMFDLSTAVEHEVETTYLHAGTPEVSYRWRHPALCASVV
jgi:hypothetical protein